MVGECLRTSFWCFGIFREGERSEKGVMEGKVCESPHLLCFVH